MFYHVSKNDHGIKFKFTPKIPESAIISKEGNIPRVCVSTDIFYCLRSISSHKKLYSMDIILECVKSEEGVNPPAIYFTESEPYLPPRVSDFRKNNEYWFIKPIVMYRVGYIDLVELTKGKIAIINKFRVFTHKELSGDGKDVLIKK